jgi:hypothetical protein
MLGRGGADRRFGRDRDPSDIVYLLATSRHGSIIEIRVV